MKYINYMICMLAIAVCILATVLIAADQGPEKGVFNVQLSLDAGSGRFVQGEPLKIKCILTNSGDGLVVFPRVGFRFFDRELIITDEHGKAVKLTTYGEELAHSCISVGADTLAPHHQRTDILEPIITHDLSRPGKYTVVVRLHISRNDDSDQCVIQSKGLNITVVQASDDVVQTTGDGHDEPAVSAGGVGDKPKVPTTRKSGRT